MVLAACGGGDDPPADPGAPDAEPGPRTGDPDGGPDGPPIELCTPSRRGAVPADEDGDGVVDEGCAWRLGPAHALTAIDGGARRDAAVHPMWISRDGLRLYTVSTLLGVRALVSTREGTDRPFGPGVPIPGDFEQSQVAGIALSGDESEAYFVAVSEPGLQEVYRSVRGPDGRFGPGLLVTMQPQRSIAGKFHLRGDGLELVYATTHGGLYRALRASTGDAFSTTERLTGIPGEGTFAPTLSSDGRMLFYSLVEGEVRRFFRAERSDPATAAFGEPLEVVDLQASGTTSVGTVALSEATREFFYSSAQPWAPTEKAIFRAPICRDGPCPALAHVPCAGVRSPDGLHCYTALPAPQTHAAAAAGCASLGASLVSISSAAEHDLVWTTFGASPLRNLWAGGYDDRPASSPGVLECNRRGASSAPWPCAWAWESGELWTYAGWAVTPMYGDEPNEWADGEEDCLQLWGSVEQPGRFNDALCTEAALGVCETTLFPTW
jgi:hypothetical protein